MKLNNIERNAFQTVKIHRTVELYGLMYIQVMRLIEKRKFVPDILLL